MKKLISCLLFSLCLLGGALGSVAQDFSWLFQRFDATGLSYEDRRFLQAALAFEGHYKGLLDGDWGRLSNEALDRYAQKEYDSSAEEWHAAALAVSLVERFEADGWELRYFENTGLSFLFPATSVFIEESTGNTIDWRHTNSTLSYAVGVLDLKTAQAMHNRTLNMQSAAGEPYMVRKDNLAVSSSTTSEGMTVYTRSDYMRGAWSTIVLAAAMQDSNLLGAVASSITVGRAPPLVFTTGGKLDDSISDTFAFLESAETKQPASSDANSGEAAESARTNGAGSGFFVSDDGYVLTNAHVISGCGSVLVDGAAASVVNSNEGFDLALLKTDFSEGKGVAVFSAAPAKLNSDVTVLGYPYAGLLGGLNVTRGSVSSLTGLSGDAITMQITAPVQSGNSGGPIVGADGEVVGVVVSKLDALRFADALGDLPQSVNFAVRGEIAKLFLAQNSVDPILSLTDEPLEPEDLAKEAQKFTVFVECR